MHVYANNNMNFMKTNLSKKYEAYHASTMNISQMITPSQSFILFQISLLLPGTDLIKLQFEFGLHFSKPSQLVFRYIAS